MSPLRPRPGRPRLRAAPSAATTGPWRAPTRAAGLACSRTTCTSVSACRTPGIACDCCVAGESAETRRDLKGLTLAGAPIMVVGSNGQHRLGLHEQLRRLERPGPRRALARRSALSRPPPDGSRCERITETVRSSQRGDARRRRSRPPNGDRCCRRQRPATCDERRQLALAWTAHDPEATNLQWLELETVGDCAAALPVANTIGGPVQNFVCADADGNIGWTLLGRMPLRGAGYDAGVPSDWTRPDTGWHGWRASGGLSARAEPGDRAHLDRQQPRRGCRAARGDRRRLAGPRRTRATDPRCAVRDRAEGSATEADMLRIQLDDRALFLVRWRDLLLKLLDEPALEGQRRAGRVAQAGGGRGTRAHRPTRSAIAWSAPSTKRSSGACSRR